MQFWMILRFLANFNHFKLAWQLSHLGLTDARFQNAILEIFTDLGISGGFSVGGFEFAARKNPISKLGLVELKALYFE